MICALGDFLVVTTDLLAILDSISYRLNLVVHQILKFNKNLIQCFLTQVVVGGIRFLELLIL